MCFLPGKKSIQANFNPHKKLAVPSQENKMLGEGLSSKVPLYGDTFSLSTFSLQDFFKETQLAFSFTGCRVIAFGSKDRLPSTDGRENAYAVTVLECGGHVLLHAIDKNELHVVNRYVKGVEQILYSLLCCNGISICLRRGQVPQGGEKS
jgi:hypothetical protein